MEERRKLCPSRNRDVCSDLLGVLHGLSQLHPETRGCCSMRRSGHMRHLPLMSLNCYSYRLILNHVCIGYISSKNYSLLRKSLSSYVYGCCVHSLTLRLLMSYIYIYMEHLFLMFLDHTQRRTTVGRTPLDE